MKKKETVKKKAGKKKRDKGELPGMPDRTELGEKAIEYLELREHLTRTKEKLEETDKQLWAAISITQFDNLIKNYFEAQNYEGNIPEKIASIWTDIRKGNIDPHKFLEKPALIKKQLKKIIDYFGSNRISISSPECGLNSFPNLILQ